MYTSPPSLGGNRYAKTINPIKLRIYSYSYMSNQYRLDEAKARSSVEYVMYRGRYVCSPTINVFIC